MDATTNTKCRIITLTHRAPVRIVETEWPAIACGVASGDNVDISVRVRQHVRKPERYLAYAVLRLSGDESGDKNVDLRYIKHGIRVGRLSDDIEAGISAAGIIWMVGGDLLGRVPHKLHVRVHEAVDACIARLPAKQV
jgi:hypothetical protein